MEVFEGARPFYLKMGMSYEAYWDGPVSEHKAYREAEKMRHNEANKLAWLQGSYFYEALLDAAPVLKAFSKQRARPYRDAPYDLDAEEKKKREEREQKRRYKRVKDKIALFAEAFNKEKNKTPERKEETVNG